MAMTVCLAAGILTGATDRLSAANPTLPLLNDPVDVSGDFRDFSNLYYLADKLADFDPATGTGRIAYQRAEYFTRQAFDNMLAVIKPVGLNEFPEDQYAVNPTLPFSVEFVSPRTVRIRATSGPQVHKQLEELMLAGPCQRMVPGNTRKLTAATVTPANSAPSRSWKIPGASSSGTRTAGC